jgi:hypothetical protein
MPNLEELAAQSAARSTGIPYASTKNRILIPKKDDNLAEYVPEDFARKNLVLPLFIDSENNIFAVAMVDPTHPPTLEKLKQMTRKDVQPFVATKSSLLKSLDGFYE